MRSIKPPRCSRRTLGWLCVALLSFPIDGEAAEARERRTFAPLEASSSLDPDKVALGRMLFHDPELSKSRAISCASCHDLARGGTVPLSRAIAEDGKEHSFNAPTIFNVAANYLLGWRGKHKSLETVSERVLLDSRLMASDWDLLAARLRQDRDYAARFRRIYGRHADRESVLDALVTFQRSLVTPNSRFDRHLRGDGSALTAGELRGLKLFMTYGCASCHQGANLGGNMRQRFGIFSQPDATGTAEGAAAKARLPEDSDDDLFRVPSLRNVAVTAPYFHDGRIESLSEAVSIMGQRQLGQTLSASDTDAIVSFLKTLTGEYDGRELENSVPAHDR
ncbi:cytochrome c peroxidase [Rhodopseudomonas palustris]|uniref:cytochrome-c peroxidase n=1 Tax=Rhodopseudomonas palustris TaxID=1076 RepID=UPI002ACD3537|nr:cytochrome c peroxidase [Rhodopseudomonas palustris]WQG98832.1 cytochrome c peroxidase [Rhodopseudomonas palustris]